MTTIQVDYTWHLRRILASKGMWRTTDLIEPLAGYGIKLLPSSLHRLVAGKPQRLSLDTLAALCGVFDCDASDLITVHHRR